ncbi:uncharacterized protein [Diadema setosum]|uniref:uncharacterized protein n=1 Tax=Diadema setosum TaxID=31175 RepID=UPI003B3ACE4D
MASERRHTQINREEQLLFSQDNDRTKRTIATGDSLPPFLQNPYPVSTSPSSLPSSYTRMTTTGDLTRRNPSWNAVLMQMLENAEHELAVPTSSNPPRESVGSSSLLSMAGSSSSSSCAYCVRRRRSEVIGYDSTGAPVSMDVGGCRKRIKKRSRNSGSSGNRCTQCSTGDVCVPSVVRMEQTHLPTGSNVHRVIVNCSCRARPPAHCVRRPKHVIFSPHSPYETLVDVGMCEGRCEEGPEERACRPIRNRTVALRGPNGARVVDTIEECSCEAQCYRAVHLESLYTRTWNSTTNQTQVTTAFFDVGKCVGVCPPTNICVLTGEDGECKMSLVSKSSSCQAKSRQKHSVILRDGTPRSIYSIKSCFCSGSGRV